MSEEIIQVLSSDRHTFLSASCFHPDDGEPVATMLIHHGMNEHKGRYEWAARQWAMRGIAVMTFDAVGHGDSISPDSTLGRSPYMTYASLLKKDLCLMIERLLEIYPHLPLFLLGHSLGSFVIRTILPKIDNRVAGAILMGSGDIPAPLLAAAWSNAATSAALFGPQHKSELGMWLATSLLNIPFGPHQNHAEWQTSDFGAETDYLFDAKCNFVYDDGAYRDFYRLIHEADDFNEHSTICRSMPLLFLSGKADIVGGFGYAIPLLIDRAEKSGFSKAEGRLYDNARHELLHESVRIQVINDASEWIEKNLPSKEETP